MVRGMLFSSPSVVILYVTHGCRCYYDSRNDPWLTIHPVKVEEMHREPNILMFHGLLTTAEMKEIIAIGTPLVRY